MRKGRFEDTEIQPEDSSHTIIPFHALGMITGLENVRVFFEEFMDPAHRSFQHHGQLERPFWPTGLVQRCSDHRRPDTQAMTDMSVEHYHGLSVDVKPSASRTMRRTKSALQRYLPILNWIT